MCAAKLESHLVPDDNTARLESVGNVNQTTCKFCLDLKWVMTPTRVLYVSDESGNFVVLYYLPSAL